MYSDTSIYTFIEVPFSFYHRHYYENAPAGVEFLKAEHPHDFKCEVMIQVFEDDRELEFYLVREFLNSKIRAIKRSIGKKASCEMIAATLYKIVSKEYGLDRAYTIRVSEDGLYSATKMYLGVSNASR